MKKMLTTLALALAIAAPGTGSARDRHVLWTVEGRHNTVYLLGSIHVLRPNDGGLPQVAEAAYQDAERLVMELDMDDSSVVDPTALLEVMQRLAVLPDGMTLRDVLGSDYDRINDQARATGIDLALLDRFAPWFVGTTLLQLELAKRGFSPELGVEQRFAARAARDGKEIVGLETPEQQFALLAGLPMAQQKRFLLMSLEETEDLDEQVDGLVRAWRSGDVEHLAELLSREFDDFPELYRPLTEDRNREWVGDIEALLDDRDDYLVVVGALHLVGANSVVDLLRRRGHEVTQQ